MHIFDTPFKPYQLFLNSRNFTNKIGTEGTHFIYELNQPISKQVNMDMLIKLESFQFTNSIFNVNDTNNIFSYCFSSTGSPVFNIIVEPGNYTIEELVTYLTNNATGDLSLSYNPDTLKVTINSLRVGGFRLMNGVNNKTIYNLLGFESIQSDETLYMSRTGPYIINMNSNLSLNLILNNIRLHSNFVKGSSHYNILNNVPIISGFGEVQTYTPCDFKYLVDTDDISSLELSIMNQDFKNVDFNGLHWYLTMTIEFLYKRELNIPDSVFANNESATYFNQLRDRLLDAEKERILNENN